MPRRAPNPPARSATALLGLAQNAAALLEVLAEEKNQTINVAGDSGLLVNTDAAMLKRALVNLLDNAIKYSPRDAVIDVAVRPWESGAAVVEVRDQGCGIPREHQGRVFDRFYRVDAGRAREGGGVGLGLAIAHRVVKQHGGRDRAGKRTGSRERIPRHLTDV